MVKKAHSRASDEHIAAELRPLARDVASLTEDPKNARNHGEENLAAIEASLRAHGQRKPIVVKDGVVLAGNGTLRAARELGWKTLACVEYEGPEALARAYAIADNRSAEQATWDPELLALALRDADAAGLLDATSFGRVAADEALGALLAKDGPLDGDDPGPEDPPEEAESVTGEIYLLGRHRLLCGDSTKGEDVARLMGEERSPLMATDPPYLVDYDASNHPQSFSSRGRKTQNKTWDAYKDPEAGVEFFSSFLRAAMDHALRAGFALYQWHASRRSDLVVRAWEESDLLAHQSIVWVKGRPVLTRSHFMWQYEPCWYGWRKGFPPELRPPTNQPNVWPISQKGQQDGIHPTQKPTEIFEWPIAWHTKPDEVVYEPFCGSGSQLIAAAKLGRRCYAIEISPSFCDVIRRRWTSFARSAGVAPGEGGLE
jgi:DNA modification methylase